MGDLSVEQLDLLKYQDRIRRRRAWGLAVCLLLAVVASASVADPEIPARVAVAACPASPAGRRGAVYLLDRELDRALAAYRYDESARRHIAGNFESLGARDDGLAGEVLQREEYLAAMKTRILALQAERRRLAVEAGVENRIDREIDYWRELDNDGQ
jgi:hypothetical protein